jgi:hypothetical protein
MNGKLWIGEQSRGAKKQPVSRRLDDISMVRNGGQIPVGIGEVRRPTGEYPDKQNSKTERRREYLESPPIGIGHSHDGANISYGADEMLRYAALSY